MPTSKSWRAAKDLVTHVYRLTAGFPKDELYGLTSQFAEPRFPSRATLPRERDALTELTQILFTQEGLFSKSRPNSGLPRGWTILQLQRLKPFCAELLVSVKC